MKPKRETALGHAGPDKDVDQEGRRHPNLVDALVMGGPGERRDGRLGHGAAHDQRRAPRHLAQPVVGEPRIRGRRLVDHPHVDLESGERERKKKKTKKETRKSGPADQAPRCAVAEATAAQKERTPGKSGRRPRSRESQASTHHVRNRKKKVKNLKNNPAPVPAAPGSSRPRWPGRCSRSSTRPTLLERRQP